MGAAAAGAGGVHDGMNRTEAARIGGFIRKLLQSYREAHPSVAIDIVEGLTSEHTSRVSERLE
jgi:hypothetical protein